MTETAMEGTDTHFNSQEKPEIVDSFPLSNSLTHILTLMKGHILSDQIKRGGSKRIERSIRNIKELYER